MVQKFDQPCHFYIIDGSCKYGSHCWFAHGLDLFGRIEMEIRALLHMPYAFQVPLEDLPGTHPELGIMFRHVEWDGTLDHLTSLLGRLHTICVIYDRCLVLQNSYRRYAILLESAPFYLGYYPYNPNVMGADSEAHQIYITFSAQSREICTEANVRQYFSHFGHVLSVNIPRERSYGFVRFQYPETVRLLLSNWNAEVPHFIFGAGLYVRPYISYNHRNPAENHGPNGPNGGLEHMPNAPGELPGQVPDVPDEYAEQQDMNPAENHGPNGPNGGLEHMPNAPGELPGQVPDVPDEYAEQQDMNPAGNHVPNGPVEVLDQVLGVLDGEAAELDMNPAGNHVPNGPVEVPDQVLGVLDGEAAELDMNPAGNHVPNAPVGVPDQVPNALGGAPGVPDEVPDGDAAQQETDEIAAALPGVDCFYYQET